MFDQSQRLDIAIAAGGTAGHVNPALALAEELRDRGHSVRFFGQPKRLEGRLVPEAGFELVGLEITGLDRSRPWTAVSALARMAAARRIVRRELQRRRPDAAIGFGAYIELPLLTTAKSMHIPFLLHEQNSVPGLANKTMAKGAAEVCISLPAARGAFAQSKGKNTPVVLTGNPVRRSVVSATREAGRRSLELSEDESLLLVFGGSLGAKSINDALWAMRDELMARPGQVVLHSTGAGDFERCSVRAKEAGVDERRWRTVPYIAEMGAALAAADLVISRAGASSVAEIAALAAPSILVPYPQATADHQTTNARYLVDAGAAVVVPDHEVIQNGLAALTLGLLNNPGQRAMMRTVAAGLGQARAAVALADRVEAVARAHKRTNEAR